MTIFDYDLASIGVTWKPKKYCNGNARFVCPFCKDSRGNPNDDSLAIEVATGEYMCHHCGETGKLKLKNGNMNQFLSNGHNTNALRNEVRIPEPAFQKGTTIYGEKEKQYFKYRGISEETIRKCKITTGTDTIIENNKKRVVDCIFFNFFEGGRLINVKGRYKKENGSKCFSFEAGRKITAWNIDSCKGERDVIITEGEFDALSFIECGYKSVISVPNGCKNLGWLDAETIKKYFDDKDFIFIAGDTDTEGVKMRDELIVRFGAERCRVIEYGDKYKDANELFVAEGKEALIRAYRKAESEQSESIKSVEDYEAQLDNIYLHGLPQGLGIGHENFDSICKFETKRLCVVTGVPGSGKSEFIDEIAERMNWLYGWKWGIFSPENAPTEYHAVKLIEKIVGKTFSQKYLTETEYNEVKKKIASDFLHIDPSDNKLSSVLQVATELVRLHGIKGLIIDPYNRLENEQPSGMNETQYISQMLDKITNFAVKNDCLVILMAHPAKSRDGDKNYIPTLYDISGSANFYNKADFGIVVHRDRERQVTVVIVQKVRFRHLGGTGKCTFKFNTMNGRYVPYNESDQTFQQDNSNHLATKENKAQTKKIDFEKQDEKISRYIPDDSNDDFFQRENGNLPF